MSEKGDTMQSRADQVVRAYHDAWVNRDYEAAAAQLAPDLVVEVPINHYPDGPSFAEALRGFGSVASGVEVISRFSEGPESMHLYDMDVVGVGPLRVAEHFTVRDGKIVKLRQIHDTAALREAGFARGGNSNER